MHWLQTSAVVAAVSLTQTRLAQDIGEFFGMWSEDRERIGKFGRNLILESYSVKRMTDDTEKVYTSVLNR